jgi:hypothetical protein
MNSEKPKHAPKRYRRVAGSIGPAVAFLLPAHHRPAIILGVTALFIVPPTLLEAWFKRRHRRSEEQLLLPSETERARSARGAAAGPIHGDGG